MDAEVKLAIRVALREFTTLQEFVSPVARVTELMIDILHAMQDGRPVDMAMQDELRDLLPVIKRSDPAKIWQTLDLAFDVIGRAAEAGEIKIS